MKLLSCLIITSGIAILTLLNSCDGKELCRDELLKYIHIPENGLTQERELNNNLLIACTYRPGSLLFHDDTSYFAEKDSILRFKVSILYNGSNSIDFVGLSKFLTEKTASGKSMFYISQGGGRFPIYNVLPISYQGTASRVDYLLTIYKGQLKSKEFGIELDTNQDDINFLNNHFSFSRKSISRLPELKTNC